MSVGENATAILFNVVFKRRLTNIALMTFLPSMLLIAISYSTSYFRLPNFFNTAITVNLTVMLTTTNLLISETTKLAQTSYLKWMEGWLIFAQLVPFIQVWVFEQRYQKTVQIPAIISHRYINGDVHNNRLWPGDPHNVQ